MARDPVCGMEIEEQESAGKSFYKGTMYYFCAPSCKRSFDNEPKKYLQKLLYELQSYTHNQHKETKQ